MWIVVVGYANKNKFFERPEEKISWGTSLCGNRVGTFFVIVSVKSEVAFFIQLSILVHCIADTRTTLNRALSSESRCSVHPIADIHRISLPNHLSDVEHVAEEFLEYWERQESKRRWNQRPGKICYFSKREASFIYSKDVQSRFHFCRCVTRNKRDYIILQTARNVLWCAVTQQETWLIRAMILLFNDQWYNTLNTNQIEVQHFGQSKCNQTPRKSVEGLDGWILAHRKSVKKAGLITAQTRLNNQEVFDMPVLKRSWKFLFAKRLMLPY